MFRDIAFSPREIKVSDTCLEAIYKAARLGLKGDNLAYASGMTPFEFRQLRELSPAADIAASKGRADAEMEAAGVLRDAAVEGDAKVALDILRHTHGWVAKQQLSVDIEQRISIVGALQEAQKRIEGVTIDQSALPSPEDNA